MSIEIMEDDKIIKDLFRSFKRDPHIAHKHVIRTGNNALIEISLSSTCSSWPWPRANVKAKSTHSNIG